MSFPKLVLFEQDSSHETISGIDLDYGDAVPLPYALIRASYNVTRQMSLQGPGTGTKQRWSDLPYTYVRRVHKWVGYVDVLTSSVAYSPIANNSQTLLNVQLIQTALFLRTSNGVFSQVPLFLPNNEGPSNPGTPEGYGQAFDPAAQWAYKKGVSQENVYADFWMISGMSVSDNMNSSSRFTLNLNLVEPWVNIAEKIDAF